MREKPFTPPADISTLTEAGIPDHQIDLARDTSEELRGILMAQKDKPAGPSVHDLFTGYAEQHAKKMDPAK